MFNFLIIAAMATAASAGPLPREFNNPNPFTPTGRIVGGKPVTIQEVPHQVSLQIRGFGYCGGTIIGERWIVTAAHCADYTPSSVTVRLGSHRMSSGGSVHGIETIIRHEKFSINKYGIPLNDVAVMRLVDEIEFDDSRKPIGMFETNEESIAGTAAVITGWGAVREGGGTSESLRIVSVPMITKEVCSEAYGAYGGIPPGQICAAHPQGGKDACQGDSGGPMTIGGRLAGIVSWGNGCARPGYPGVYTEIAHYRDWISDKTGL